MTNLGNIFLLGGGEWIEISDGDRGARALYDRHYKPHDGMADAVCLAIYGSALDSIHGGANE